MRVSKLYQNNIKVILKCKKRHQIKVNEKDDEFRSSKKF